jgi:hypothetical protein
MRTDEALRLGADGPEALQLRGQLLAAAGRLREASESFEAMRAAAPDDARAEVALTWLVPSYAARGLRVNPGARLLPPGHFELASPVSA